MWLYFYFGEIISEEYKHVHAFKVNFLFPASSSWSLRLYYCNYYYYFTCIATEILGQAF